MVELSPDYEGWRIRVDGHWNQVQMPLGTSQDGQPVYKVKTLDGRDAVAKYIPPNIPSDDLSDLNRAVGITSRQVDDVLGSVMARHLCNPRKPGEWILTSYAPGVSLSALDLSGIDPSLRLQAVKSLLEAVQRNLLLLKQRGLVFGDLRPENIVISDQELGLLMRDPAASVSVTFIDPDQVAPSDSDRDGDDEQAFESLREFLFSRWAHDMAA